MLGDTAAYQPLDVGMKPKIRGTEKHKRPIKINKASQVCIGEDTQRASHTQVTALGFGTASLVIDEQFVGVQKPSASCFSRDSRMLARSFSKSSMV